jgi:hypothetical protein
MSKRPTNRYIAYLHREGHLLGLQTNPLVLEWSFLKGRCRNRCGKSDLPFHYSDVQTQEACNNDDDDHYADDVENVHCVLRFKYAQFQCESAALE